MLVKISFLPSEVVRKRTFHRFRLVHAVNYVPVCNCSSLLESSGRFSSELSARNLFGKVVPLIRTEAVQEIREVAITALGMVHPNAFG